MSTGMIESWTGDMTTVGPLYPFVGSEVFLWLVAMLLWVLWHVWQARFESRSYAEQEERFRGEELRKAINGDR